MSGTDPLEKASAWLKALPEPLRAQPSELQILSVVARKLQQHHPDVAFQLQAMRSYADHRPLLHYFLTSSGQFLNARGLYGMEGCRDDWQRQTGKVPANIHCQASVNVALDAPQLKESQLDDLNGWLSGLEFEDLQHSVPASSPARRMSRL